MVIIGVRKLVGGVAAALAVTMLLVSSPASATTIDECKTLINIVRTTLVSADIFGGNPDRTRAGLKSKLDGADAKLDQGKFDPDALQKLSEFQSKVRDLRDAGKPKIDVNDANQLIDEVDDAIVCVQNLIAGV